MAGRDRADDQFDGDPADPGAHGWCVPCVRADRCAEYRGDHVIGADVVGSLLRRYPAGAGSKARRIPPPCHPHDCSRHTHGPR